MSTSHLEGKTITVAETARRLRVSKVTVYRLLRSGDLPAVRAGHGYRVREEDVRRWLAQRYRDAG